MTKSDIQRIKEAAKAYSETLNIVHEELGYRGYSIKDFKAGAQYEHPIAYNQAIEDVIKLTFRSDVKFSIEEILKLRK